MLKHLKSSEEWSEKSLGAKGFTLIELLVVIIILGILAAVAIFAIGNIQDNAETSACETERGIVRTGIAAWVAEDPSVNEASAADWTDIDPYLDGGVASISYSNSTSGTIDLDTNYDCTNP